MAQSSSVQYDVIPKIFSNLVGKISGKRVSDSNLNGPDSAKKLNSPLLGMLGLFLLDHALDSGRSSLVSPDFRRSFR